MMTLPRTCSHGVLIYERCLDCESSDGPPTGTDAMGVVNEGREPCPDCGDIGIVPAVGLGYGGDAEPDMEPCRNPVHDGDVPADAVEAVKALRFRTMLRGRGNPDSEELHHTPAGAREVVEALRAIGWGPADTHEVATGPPVSREIPDVDLRFVRAWVARHEGQRVSEGTATHNPCDLCVVAGVLGKLLDLHVGSASAGVGGVTHDHSSNDGLYTHKHAGAAFPHSHGEGDTSPADNPSHVQEG